MEDQRYAGQVMNNLRRSSNDMREVLDKVNSRQGTLGLLINDPSLYNETTNLMARTDGASHYLGVSTRVAPVRYDRLAELCAAGCRADELQPGSRQAPPAAGATNPAPTAAPQPELIMMDAA